MSQDEKSKIFAECIKGLYGKGKYTIEYAILQLEKYMDNGKIIASDYEEYLIFFVSEMNKENEVEEKTAENTTENVENSVEETANEETNQESIII